MKKLLQERGDEPTAKIVQCFSLLAKGEKIIEQKSMIEGGLKPVRLDHPDNSVSLVLQNHLNSKQEESKSKSNLLEPESEDQEEEEEEDEEYESEIEKDPGVEEVKALLRKHLKGVTHKLKDIDHAVNDTYRFFRSALQHIIGKKYTSIRQLLSGKVYTVSDEDTSDQMEVVKS